MNRLAVFARWPIPGSVKSRLSPALPADLACRLHRAMLEDTLAACEGAGAGERFLYWADAPTDHGGFPDPEGVIVREQYGRVLGERLGHAFAGLLAGPGHRAIVVGADCPELESAAIRQAFDALATSDLAVGPASDGGYYLLGLRRAAPALFEGIAWSTDRVLEQTLERASDAGLTTALLPRLADLDTPDDLVRYVAQRALRAGAAGRHTQAALREMGLLPAGV